MKKHNPEQRLAKQKAILQSAKELFSNKGYSKTSIKDIAVGAGVSIGTIYNVFDNIGKERLALMCLGLESAPDIWTALLSAIDSKVVTENAQG